MLQNNNNNKVVSPAVVILVRCGYHGYICLRRDFVTCSFIPRLFRLPEGYFDLPTQALFCIINGLVPAGEQWTQESLDEVMKLLINVPVIVRVVVSEF